jgi:hypothetical protein
MAKNYDTPKSEVNGFLFDPGGAAGNIPHRARQAGYGESNLFGSCSALESIISSCSVRFEICNRIRIILAWQKYMNNITEYLPLTNYVTSLQRTGR